MARTTWQCARCNKVYFAWKNPPGSEPEISRSHEGCMDLCQKCSVESAQELLPMAPPVLQWYVSYLKRQLGEEREARDADVRSIQRELYDYMDEHGGR